MNEVQARDAEYRVVATRVSSVPSLALQACVARDLPSVGSAVRTMNEVPARGVTSRLHASSASIARTAVPPAGSHLKIAAIASD